MKLHLPKLLLTAVIAAGMSLGQAFAAANGWEYNDTEAYYIMEADSAETIDAHSTAANRIYQIKAAANHTAQKTIGTLILRNKSVNRFMRNWSGPTSLNASIGTLKFGSNGDGSGTLISDGGNDITIGQIDGTLVGLYNGAKLTIGRDASEGVEATTTTIGGTLLNSGPADNTAGMYTTGSAGTMTIKGDIVVVENIIDNFELIEAKSPNASIGYTDGDNGFCSVKDAYFYLVKGNNATVKATSATTLGTSTTVDLDSDETGVFIYVDEFQDSIYHVNKGTVTYNAETMSAATGFSVAKDASYIVDKGGDAITINTFIADITVETGGKATVKTTGAVTQNGDLSIDSGTTLTVDGAASYENNGHAINNGGTLVLNNVTEATFTRGSERIIASNVTLSGETTLKFSGNSDITDETRKNLVWKVGSDATLDFGDTRQVFGNGFILEVDGGKVIGTGNATHGALDAYSNATIKATADSTVDAVVRVRNGQLSLDAGKTKDGKDIQLTIAGKIITSDNNHSGSVNKIGEGIVVLQGANTYKNGTTVTAGTLRTENTDALGTGAVSVTGGKLQVAKDLTISSLTLSGAGALDLAGGTLNVTGSLTLAAADVTVSKLSSYFNAETLSATLVTTSGEGNTLTVNDLNTWTGGAYSIDGQHYTTSLSVENNSLKLNFTLETLDVYVTKDGSVYAGGTLTLAMVDANGNRIDKTADNYNVIGLYGGAEWDAIRDLITDGENPVAITLQGADGFTIVGSGDLNSDPEVGAGNVSFYGKYYGEANVGGAASTGKYNPNYIPEPASATLGLAALMMLATRRRRKA